MATIRALWAIQDKIALTPDEEHAIDLKRDLVAGQERAIWSPKDPRWLHVWARLWDGGA